MCSADPLRRYGLDVPTLRMRTPRSPPHKLASYDPRCEFGSERVEAEGRACRGRRAGSSPDGRRGEAHAVEGVREPLRAVHVGLHL